MVSHGLILHVDFHFALWDPTVVVKVHHSEFPVEVGRITAREAHVEHPLSLIEVKITSTVSVELGPDRLDEFIPMLIAVVILSGLFLFLDDDVFNVDVGVQMVRQRGWASLCDHIFSLTFPGKSNYRHVLLLAIFGNRDVFWAIDSYSDNVDVIVFSFKDQSLAFIITVLSFGYAGCFQCFWASDRFLEQLEVSA